MPGFSDLHVGVVNLTEGNSANIRSLVVRLRKGSEHWLKMVSTAVLLPRRFEQSHHVCCALLVRPNLAKRVLDEVHGEECSD